LIPKLLSSRSKEERLKRQDSKDDIRHLSRSTRKDFKEESRSPSLVISPTSTKDEVCKSGIRIFRRDNSREDVGRDSANSIKESAKGKQHEKQEKTEVVGGAVRLKATGEQSRTKCEDGKDDANDIEGSSSKREAIASIEPDLTVLNAQPDKKADGEEHQDSWMIDMIIAENRTQNEQIREQDTMVSGNETIDEKHLLATREPVESVAENDKGQDNDEEETQDTTEQLLDVGSDGDVIGITSERKGSLEIGYGKRPDEFQVVSECLCIVCGMWAQYTRAYPRARVCGGVTSILSQKHEPFLLNQIYSRYFTFHFHFH